MSDRTSSIDLCRHRTGQQASGKGKGASLPDLEDLQMSLDPLGIVLQLALAVLLPSFREEEEGTLDDRCIKYQE